MKWVKNKSEILTHFDITYLMATKEAARILYVSDKEIL